MGTPTQSNYYTKENTYLSTSKIKDFLLDEYYFYREHIKRDLAPKKQTKSMFIGEMVDVLVTRGKRVFNDRFVRVQRRSKDGIISGAVEVTAAEYDKAVRLAEAVRHTDVYKDIRKNKFQSQVILTHNIDVGIHFSGVCGMLDWVKVYDDHAVIVDLKTTQHDKPQKYRYDAEDLKYFLSMAMYRFLVRKNFGDNLPVDCYHITACTKDGVINPVQLYKLSDERLDTEEAYLLSLFEKIKEKKVFKKKKVQFSEYFDLK